MTTPSLAPAPFVPDLAAMPPRKRALFRLLDSLLQAAHLPAGEDGQRHVVDTLLSIEARLLEGYGDGGDAPPIATTLAPAIRDFGGIGLDAKVVEGTLEDMAAGLRGHRALLVLDGVNRFVLVTRAAQKVRLDDGERARQVREGEIDGVVEVPPGDVRVGLILGGQDDLAQKVAPKDAVLTASARALRLLAAEKQDIGVVVVYGIAIGLIALATPVAVQSLVNTVAFGTLFQPLVVLTLLLFGFLIFGAVLRALQFWVVEMLQRRLFVRLVGQLAHRLPRLHASVSARGAGPELVNRFFDVFTVQKSVANLLLSGVEAVLTALVGLAVLGFYHPLLLAFDVFLIFMIVLVIFVLGRGGSATAIVESKKKYAVAGWLEELARHPVSFKLQGGADYALRETDVLARGWLLARAEHFRVVIRQVLSAMTLQAIASAGLLGVGGLLVIRRQLTLGQLVAAELIVTLVVAQLAKLGKQLESYYDLVAGVDKLSQLLDLPLEADEANGPLDDGAPGVPVPSTGPASVRLHDVCFRYAPKRSKVLDQCSLFIEPGDRVGLFGRAQSGKSTLADMLFRLQRPENGYVEVDGVDAREYVLEDLRGRVALIREAEGLPSTILENVRVGRPGVTTADVHEALRIVGLDDELKHLPKGLRTELTYGGAPLTPSQALRLTLARAIAGRPGLLVLDEVLDGMDGPTRTQVVEGVLDPAHPWSVLIISNRPEVLRRCEKVYRMHHDGPVLLPSNELPSSEDGMEQMLKTYGPPSILPGQVFAEEEAE
ncbi:MAG: ATP-binding cassette domain-containing protein [Myxococcota bacterium]